MSKFLNGVKKRATTALFGLAIGLLLSGCGRGNTASPTGWFTTSSIYAYMKAVQDESGNVLTTVQLRDGATGTANYLYLSSGETLYSSLDIPPQQYINISGDLFNAGLDLSQFLKLMAARNLYTDYFLFNQIVYGKPEYFATGTPHAGTAPTIAYVDFERSGNVMTGTSSIALPGAFQVTAPVAGVTVSRAASLALAWNNVDATTTMEADVAGVCTDGSRYAMPTLSLGVDTGSATLSSANLFPASGVNAAQNCQVALILQRVRTGGVSSQFAFGSFRGVQKRTVQILTTP